MGAIRLKVKMAKKFIELKGNVKWWVWPVVHIAVFVVPVLAFIGFDADKLKDKVLSFALKGVTVDVVR